MTILEDVATLIEDLDRGRATGRVYTYGQVQERLRALAEAESARWPNVRFTSGAYLTTTALLPSYSRPRIIEAADAVVSHETFEHVRMELRVKWPETEGSPEQVGVVLHAGLDQLAGRMHEEIERKLQSP